MNLLTRNEAAKRARVCLRTFDNILESSNGPKVTRIGRRKLIPEDSLRDWLIAHTS